MHRQKEKLIIVMRQESVLTSWMRDASTLALVVALIGIGIVLESSAMQWFGAVVAFTTIIIKASAVEKRHLYDLEGAYAELDKIRDGKA